MRIASEKSFIFSENKGGSMSRWFTSGDLSLIIILSSLGGVASVPIGYMGNFLNTIPGIPFGSPQVLSGLHTLWIVLAAVLVKKTGSGTMTGVLKGLVELFLGSFHSIFVLPISLIQGILVDIIFTVFRHNNSIAMYLSSGLSSASNVLVLQLLVLPPLPIAILLFMYLISFFSGLFFAAYLGKKVLEIVRILK
jgi:ABC-type thiamin/hydroxymethylpyrimidine transport system permease subunit